MNNEYKITLYTMNNCHKCKMTKNILERYNLLEFTDIINIDDYNGPDKIFNNKDPRDFIKEEYGRQMPVVVVRSPELNISFSDIRPDLISKINDEFTKVK